MKTLRERMLEEMQRRNYSPRTITTYLSCVSRMSSYYNLSPDKISMDQIKAYLHEIMVNQGCSLALVNQTINGVKVLQKDVLGMQWNPGVLKRPKKEKRLPVILSPQEVTLILKAPVNIKHRVILALGYSAGLRISEVINLKVNHIDSKRMQIRIVGGKGRKDRNTLLSKATLNLLRSYYQRYKPTNWLIQGQAGSLAQYSSTSINCIVKKSSKKSGITKRVTFHTLRHCFATHLLEQGTSLQIIQKLLGHAHISTTGTYLHVQQYSLDKVVSPMDFQP